MVILLAYFLSMMTVLAVVVTTWINVGAHFGSIHLQANPLVFQTNFQTSAAKPASEKTSQIAPLTLESGISNGPRRGRRRALTRKKLKQNYRMAPGYAGEPSDGTPYLPAFSSLPGRGAEH